VAAADELLGDIYELFDLVEGSAPGKSVVHGRILDITSQKMITLPPNAAQPTRTLQLATEVSLTRMRIGDLDGVKVGVGATRISPVPRCSWGVLLIWNRLNRGSYQVASARPSEGVNLKKLLPGLWQDMCHVLFYNYHWEEDSHKKIGREVAPDISDIDVDHDLPSNLHDILGPPDSNGRDSFDDSLPLGSDHDEPFDVDDHSMS